MKTPSINFKNLNNNNYEKAFITLAVRCTNDGMSKRNDYQQTAGRNCHFNGCQRNIFKN
jgi:hypothetical protein